MSEVREGYKMTELGEIPIEWEIKRFGDSVFYQEGPGLRKWQFTNEGIKVINVTNIVRNRLDISNTNRYISFEEYENRYKHFTLEENDIVIASSGNSWGKTAFVKKEHLPLLLNTSVIRFRPSLEADVELNYLWYFVNSRNFLNQIEFLITGSAQPNFGPYHLDRTKIIVPSFNEQQKIASILSTVDEQIDETEQLIVKTKELKKGLMQQLLTKGIGHTEFKQTELGEIPIEWKASTLGQSCVVVMGQSPKGESYNNNGHGTPLLNGPTEFGVRYPKAIQWTTSPTKLCEEGDILFTVRGSSIGKMNIANSSYCIGRGLAAIRQSEETKTEFMSHVLHYNLSKVLKNISGSTFPNITKDELLSFTLALPPLAEQQKIASILSTVDEQIEVYEQEKAKYEELKKGLMQQLLTGQIRVKI